MAALLMAGCHEPSRVHKVEASAMLDQAELDFGEVPVGEWRERQVTLRNVGYVSFTAMEALQLEGNPSYSIELNGGSLESGEEKTVTVRFHPLAEGQLQDTVQVNTDADNGPSRKLEVKGLGTPTPVRIFPAAIDFENLEIDSDRTLELTVENPVDIPLTLTVGGEHAGQFESDTVTIPPLSTRQIRTRYFPRAAGDSRAQVEVRSCAGCTPTTGALAGRAVTSAFAFDPAPVPFENVPVHERTQSKTRARNITWRPVQVGALSTSDDAFTPLSSLAQKTVAPGETVEVDLQFAARHNGPSLATMTMGYQSNKPRAAEVMLDARGGKPQLALAPVAIDFGDLPVGAKVEKVVRLSNAGSLGALHFRGVRSQGDVEAFDVSPTFRGSTQYPWVPEGRWPTLPSPQVAIEPGNDFLDLKVYFQPGRAGEVTADLVVQTDDLFNPERTVRLTGRAYEAGPCSFRVLPAGRLDFGNVPVGEGAVLGFRFENAGGNACAVKDIHLSNTAGGAFFMPGGALTGGVVIQDDSFAAQIAFRSKTAGLFEGELVLTVSDPTQPTFRLPLTAVAQTSCLTAAPNYLDFGAIRYDCAPEARRTLVSNRCATPVTVSSLDIGAGTSDQFSLVSAPTLPMTLQPGHGFEVQTTYARKVHGQHYSPLFAQADSEPYPLLIPMLAETNHEGNQIDPFVQGTDSQLDVLFVVSNSTTMTPYQSRLKAALKPWLEKAKQEGVDLRIGVTTTGLVARSETCPGGANGGEAGRLFPVDGSRARVVSSASPQALDVLAQNLDVGRCHNLVQGLETMRAALSAPLVDGQDDPRTPAVNDGNVGFLRAAARLAVVFLADEDDHSGFDPESYVQLLKTIKGPGMGHRVAAYAIVPTDSSCLTAGPPGPRFVEVARETGGAALSVCTPSYDGLLSLLTTRASGPQADFPLSAQPASVDDVRVFVNGQEVPRTDWTYDAKRTAVVFLPGKVPASGRNIQVRYRSVCGTPPQR